MTSELALTIAGIVGSALIIGAYFLNQRGTLASTDWRFPGVNALGATLILLSLTAAWNLPAAIVESFWVVVSLYGLWRARALRASRDA